MRAFVGFCLLLCCCILPVHALDVTEILDRQKSVFQVDELEDFGKAYLGEVPLGADMDIQGILAQMLEEGKSHAQGIVKKSLHSCVLLLAIVLLFGVLEGVQSGMGKSFPVLPLVCALAIAGVAMGDMFTLVGMGQASIERMQDFSKVLLPTVAAATAAAGSPSLAVAKQLATVLFSDFLMTLIEQFLLPLTFAYLALALAYAAVGNEGLKRMGAFLKWLIQFSLGALLIVFIAYLNISGAIAGNVDASTIKAAKFTVSNVVPVVGSILSDAAETMLAGASILKSAVGVFGMLVILGMCLLPFLHLGTHYLAYKGTSALAATVAEGRTAGFIDAIGTAFGLVLGMTASCAVLLLIALISSISIFAR